MSDDTDERTAQIRRNKLRAALDDYAPDPLSVADQGRDAAAGSATGATSTSKGLPEEDLRREVPPHHGG